jgi:hypothetical protein
MDREPIAGECVVIARYKNRNNRARAVGRWYAVVDVEESDSTICGVPQESLALGDEEISRSDIESGVSAV